MKKEWRCLKCNSRNEWGVEHCEFCKGEKLHFSGASILVTNDREYESYFTDYGRRVVLGGGFESRWYTSEGLCPACNKLMFIQDEMCPNCFHILDIDEKKIQNERGGLTAKNVVLWSIICLVMFGSILFYVS